MIVSAAMIPYQAKAQTVTDVWSYTGPNGSKCDTNSDFAFYFGRVGIRTDAPSVPFHIYSSSCYTGGTIYPAIERIQTYALSYGFGQSAIQFWSGLQGNQDWHVGSIKPITNASSLVFNTADTSSSDNWLGGLSFNCSGTGQQPLAANEIEVMRLYDQRVAVNSTVAKERFDIRVGFTNYHPRFTFGATDYHEWDPAFKMYTQTSIGSEFQNSYSSWIALEAFAPSALGTTQFHVMNRDTAVALGSETRTYMKERLTVTGNGNVGIGQILPDAKFQVTDGSVLFNGTTGNVPRKWAKVLGSWVQSDLDAGTRLMWIPSKAAFRAGKLIDSVLPEGGSDPDTPTDTIYGTSTSYNKKNSWDSSQIGTLSFVFGLNSRAVNSYDLSFGPNNIANSTHSPDNDQNAWGQHGAMAFGHNNLSVGTDGIAIGYRNKTTKIASFSSGYLCKAAGVVSLAMGLESTAYGDYSIALGYKDSATANHAISIGTNSEARGEYSRAIGREALAIGTNSTAIGYNVRSEGDRSFCMGYSLRGAGTKTFLIGDSIDTYASHCLIVDFPDSIGHRNSYFPSLYVDGNNVGINCSNPSATLSVHGTACIGWGGSEPIPEPIITTSEERLVSMIVENAVIIGGNQNPLWGPLPAFVYLEDTTTFVKDSGRSHGSSMLQVWGDAIKFQSDATWDIPSDARYKKDVRPYTDGLSLLKKINPVRFRYNEKLGIPQDKDGIGILAQDIRKLMPYTVRENSLARTVVTKAERQYEVDEIDTARIEVLENPVIDSHGFSVNRDSIIFKHRKRTVIEPATYKMEYDSLLTYNPSALTYLIINSIKELDTTISRVDARLDSVKSTHKDTLIITYPVIDTTNLHNENADLKQRLITIETEATTLKEHISLVVEESILTKKYIQELQDTTLYLEQRIKELEDNIKQIQATCCKSTEIFEDVLLEQNVPNPFNKQTIITYFVPKRLTGRIELVITDASGNSILHRIPVQNNIPSQYTYSATDLKTGVYLYGISLNGQIIKSKKMMIIK